MYFDFKNLIFGRAKVMIHDTLKKREKKIGKFCELKLLWEKWGFLSCKHFVVWRFFLRFLNQDDLEVIKKLTAAFEKHLRLKNLQKKEVEEELRQVEEVVKKDPTSFRQANWNECAPWGHKSNIELIYLFN